MWYYCGNLEPLSNVDDVFIAVKHTQLSWVIWALGLSVALSIESSCHLTTLPDFISHIFYHVGYRNALLFRLKPYTYIFWSKTELQTSSSFLHSIVLPAISKKKAVDSVAPCPPYHYPNPFLTYFSRGGGISSTFPTHANRWIQDVGWPCRRRFCIFYFPRT